MANRTKNTYWYSTKYDPLEAGSIDGSRNIPHDRAIERAIKAKYSPPDHSGNPFSTLFVSGLPSYTTKESLISFFSKHGQMKSVEMIYNFGILLFNFSDWKIPWLLFHRILESI